MTCSSGFRPLSMIHSAAVLRTQRHVHHVHAIVRAATYHLLNALQFLHRQLRNQQRILPDLRLSGDPAELAGAQHIPRIGKGSGDADGSGLLIHLPVDEGDRALVWISGSIGQSQR